MMPTLITAAIILLAIVVMIAFFVLMHKKGHNKKLARQQLIFADIVWKHKLEITEKEIIGNAVLAIDRLNFMMVYVQFNDREEVVHLFSLWDIQSIQPDYEYKTIYDYQHGKRFHTDKLVITLHLQIDFWDTGREKIRLLLFEYKNGIANLGSIKAQSEYWCRLVNNAVEDLPQIRTSSK